MILNQPPKFFGGVTFLFSFHFHSLTFHRKVHMKGRIPGLCTIPRELIALRTLYFDGPPLRHPFFQWNRRHANLFCESKFDTGRVVLSIRASYVNARLTARSRIRNRTRTTRSNWQTVRAKEHFPRGKCGGMNPIRIRFYSNYEYASKYYQHGNNLHGN